MPVREVEVPRYDVDIHQGHDVVSPLSPAIRNMSGLSRAAASFSAASTPSWRRLSEFDSNTGTSTFSLSEVDSNAVSPRTRSSQRIQQSNARSQGLEVTFARGDVDDTPPVDAATAVPKQTVRSWKSLSEIDSNTGSQRSGREDVQDTPYIPLLGLYAVFGVRQHPILAAPSTGSSQTRSTQRIQEFNRDLEFIFGRKEAVQEVTSGQEAVDDTPHLAVDTATVDTAAAAAAAAAVSQQTGDTAPKKPKRSRLLKELECALNGRYWTSGGSRW
jgi:hypothetical protein